MKLQIGKIVLNDISLHKNQAHKFRGYIGDKFQEFDLLHNHDAQTGRPIYRYPLFQFKVIADNPCIIAISEKTIPLLKKLFLELKEIQIDTTRIELNEKMLESECFEFGLSPERITYKFINPWIALNQANYKDYISLTSLKDKEGLLIKCLIGNILSFAKGVGYQIPDTIQPEINLQPTKVRLKGIEVIGFTGSFTVNFNLPDLIGLGKSVSRGYGTIVGMGSKPILTV